MQTKLERIAEIAKERPEERFTSLIHLINEESLIKAHRMMKAKKVPGIDRVRQIPREPEGEYRRLVNQNEKKRLQVSASLKEIHSQNRY